MVTGQEYLDIISIDENQRTLDQQIKVLEYRLKELENTVHFYRVALDGAINSNRRIEQLSIDNDARISYCYRVINQNISHYVKK